MDAGWQGLKSEVFPPTNILIHENDRLNKMNFTFMKAGKMIKIFQKVGNHEGGIDDQNLPKGWKS